jgi:transcriptional regulator GlxA family with amidase domain
MTTGEYLMQLRLKHASELLLNSDSRLKEIAEASGFPSVEYFGRCFKKHFGISPGEHRKDKTYL